MKLWCNLILSQANKYHHLSSHFPWKSNIQCPKYFYMYGPEPNLTFFPHNANYEIIVPQQMFCFQEGDPVLCFGLFQIYHAGDYPNPSSDWGLWQMDAVRDVDKSDSLFLVATTFGDHLLHHLFPTGQEKCSKSLNLMPIC